LNLDLRGTESHRSQARIALVHHTRQIRRDQHINTGRSLSAGAEPQIRKV